MHKLIARSIHSKIIDYILLSGMLSGFVALMLMLYFFYNATPTNLLNQVVYVETVKGSSGSAIYVGNNYFVTNAHVVKDGVSFVKSNDDILSVHLVAVDKDKDLAVIKTIFTPNNTPVKICWLAAKFGEDVFAIGSPYGLPNSITRGIISHPNRIRKSWIIPHHQTDALINPGNSGGGLFRSSTGCLLGMPTFLYKGAGGGINFAIPSEEIKLFLKENNINV